MNLIEVDNALKGMPDEAVAKYVVQPSPDVPGFMALSEMSRRKTMRAESQAKPQSGKSIADEVGQGLASMMPQAQNEPRTMARGGPVQGYAHGGPVQGYADGGVPGNPKAAMEHYRQQYISGDAGAYYKMLEAKAMLEGGENVIEGGAPFAGGAPDSSEYDRSNYVHGGDSYGDQSLPALGEGMGVRTLQDVRELGASTPWSPAVPAPANQSAWTSVDSAYPSRPSPDGVPGGMTDPNRVQYGTGDVTGGHGGLGGLPSPLGAQGLTQPTDTPDQFAPNPYGTRTVGGDGPDIIGSDGNLDPVFGRLSETLDPRINLGDGQPPVITPPMGADIPSDAYAVQDRVDLGDQPYTGEAMKGMADFVKRDIEGFAANVETVGQGVSDYGDAHMEYLREVVANVDGKFSQADMIGASAQLQMVGSVRGGADWVGNQFSGITDMFRPTAEVGAVEPGIKQDSDPTVTLPVYDAEGNEISPNTSLDPTGPGKRDGTSGAGSGGIGSLSGGGAYAEAERLQNWAGYTPGGADAGFDKLQANLDTLRERVEGNNSKDRGMDLVRLGATMAAGTSPYFATNFGNAANATIDQIKANEKDDLATQLALYGADTELFAARQAADNGDAEAMLSFYVAASDKMYKDSALAISSAKGASAKAPDMGDMATMLKNASDVYNGSLKGSAPRIAAFNQLMGLGMTEKQIVTIMSALKDDK